MRGGISKFVDKVVKFLSSRKFFWFIIALFVFQALWIAFSFRYSMLYDEYYHFGITQYFSHQWLPWINNQPTSLDIYGALGRNPFLLYHYLLSFPLRLMMVFISNVKLQIIALRVINIGLFTFGLVTFRRLFTEMNIKPILQNIALLFFILLPVTPFVAATINYDNLIFLLTALFMLYGIRLVNDSGRWQDLALFLLVGLAGALAKISFLPIFAAGTIFVAIIYFKKRNRKKIISMYVDSYKRCRPMYRLLMLIFLIVFCFLFFERVGVNLIVYHAINPSCAMQIGENRCQRNIIEARQTQLIAHRSTKVAVQIPNYTTTWISSMESTLSLTGANPTSSKTVYAAGLPIMSAVIYFGAIVSLSAFLINSKKIKEVPGFWFLIAIIALYIVALFVDNVYAYYKTFEPIGIQGRYLLPLLPVMFIFIILGFNYSFRYRYLKLAFLMIVFALVLQGGGLITHIVRSNESWDWNNVTVREVNNTARDILKPLVIEN